jgi:hypothetical protein
MTRERERAPFLAFCVEDKGETGVHRMKKNIFSPTIPRPYLSYYFCKNKLKKKRVKDNSLFNSMLMFFFLINSKYSR